MGYRCAEESHHRVADELLDGAAEPLELRPHVPVVAAQHGRDVLRIGLFRTGREADQVAEEDGDDLALFAQRAHAVAASSASPSSMYRVAPTER